MKATLGAMSTVLLQISNYLHIKMPKGKKNTVPFRLFPIFYGDTSIVC